MATIKEGGVTQNESLLPKYLSGYFYFVLWEVNYLFPDSPTDSHSQICYNGEKKEVIF